MDGLRLETPVLDVFGQMALDETLAQTRPEAFLLRFFRWAGPAATFGYAQRFREVERALPPGIGAACTRRPTGGGIVPHLDDLTFSCVFPAGGVLRHGAIYRRLHAAILGGLHGLGLQARLSAAPGGHAPHGPAGATQCFLQPVEQDILTDSGKVLGGAIRRYRDTVLYQGSLQMADARPRAAAYEEAIAAALAGEWGLRWQRRGVAAEVLEAARARAAKYRDPEWIRKS